MTHLHLYQSIIMAINPALFSFYDAVCFYFVQHSWTNYIYTRCQNVNRKSKASGREETSEPPTPTKRYKIDPEKHSYPSLPTNSEDETSILRNISLLKQELAKSKPNFDAVTSLMSRTFSFRRKHILDTVQRVDDIVTECPCLSKPAYVS